MAVNCAVVLLLRGNPEIFPVVEDLWIGHMEGLVLSRLDGEKILRVAQVALQIRV